MNRIRTRRHRRCAVAGFSLTEMLVSIVILVQVLVAAALLFDANNKITRVQTDVADMQQSLRIGQHDLVRTLRMVGRGGLPLQDAPPVMVGVAAPPAMPAGLAISMINQVEENTNITPGNSSSPVILAGTDVLTLRGAFTSSMYIVDWATPAGVPNSFSYDGDSGTVEICYLSTTGIPQNLAALEDLIDPESPGYPRPEALILGNRFDDRRYAVVELDPASSADTAPSCAPDGDGRTGITLAYLTTGGEHTPAYAGLSPGGDDEAQIAVRMSALLTQGVSYVGVLDEYRYYVRHEDGDGPEDLEAILTRSRFYPGTQNPYPDPADFGSLEVDLAEDVIDLQVALGFDVDGDDSATELPDNRAADEWLFNDDGDPSGAPAFAGNLLYVRVNTLARTARRDFTYQAPLHPDLEDHLFSDDAGDFVNSDEGRKFRRRWLQTVVTLRNPFQL